MSIGSRRRVFCLVFYFVVNVKAVSGLTIELATYISEWLKATSYCVYWIVDSECYFLSRV